MAMPGPTTPMVLVENGMEKGREGLLQVKPKEDRFISRKPWKVRTNFLEISHGYAL